MNIKQILFLACCLMTAPCGSEQALEPPVDTHKVINPIVKDATYSREYVAEIQAVKHVELRSKIKAHLDKIHVDEGQAVTAGQLLFTLNAMEFETELQKAEAAYKSAVADLRVAELELRNVKLLADKNIVAKTELDVAKAKLDALQADLDEARAHKGQAALRLASTEIKAPFAGTINRIPNKAGSLVEEGAILTTLSDNREVFAYFNLSEMDYLNSFATEKRGGKTVGLRLANHVLYDHEGKIETVESEFDRATGNIAFRARFPNPDGLLKQGSNGKVVVKKLLKQALFIPQKSTFEIQDKLFVFVVDPQGVLKQRNIIQKMRIPDFYVVESGLSKDEKILFEGVENMRDGDQVHAVPLDLTSVMSPVNAD